MAINEQKTKELREAVFPLMKWLKENWHPHCRVIVDLNSFELLEGVIGEEYTEDKADAYNAAPSGAKAGAGE